MQRAQALSLVGELDPTCCSEEKRVHIKCQELRVYVKILDSKITQMVTAAMKLKDTCSLE